MHGKILLYPGTWYVEKFDRQYSNITRSCSNKRQLRQDIQAFYATHLNSLTTDIVAWTHVTFI